MTDEIETNSETSESNLLEQDAGLEQALYDSITELTGGDEPEANEPVQRAEGEKPKPNLDISASEAAKILAESKKKPQKRRTVEIAKPEREQAEPEKVAAEPEQKTAPSGEKYEAPGTWNAADKEWFNKQPPEIQRNAVKWFKDAQANATRHYHELAQMRRSYQDIEQLAGRYVQQWGAQGITPTQGMAQALTFYHEVMTNPVGTIQKLIQQTGYQPGQAPNQNQGQPSQTALTGSDVQRTIQEEFARLYQQQAITAAQAEVEQVRRAMDATGRYLYPELHDPSQTVGLQYLIEAARQREPGISWGEATKRAIHTQRLLSGNTQPQISPAPPSRLPQGQNELAKVKGAAVSVKPRGNSIIPTTTADKPGTSLEESLLRAVESLTSH